MYCVQLDKRNELPHAILNSIKLHRSCFFEGLFFVIFIFRWPYGFFQVVHLTHEWMEEKLQTYFRMDTGCLNHNTSMKNCKFSLFTRSPSSYKETFFKSLTDHLNNTRYQIMMKCWKNDPDARPTFTELKNQLKEMETLNKVRILVNMKFSFHRKPSGSVSAN